MLVDQARPSIKLDPLSPMQKSDISHLSSTFLEGERWSSLIDYAHAMPCNILHVAVVTMTTALLYSDDSSLWGEPEQAVHG